MQTENHSLIENEVWYAVDISSVPSIHDTLTGKWVLKRKRNCTVEIQEEVNHGYKQRQGLGFLNTFAVVVKSTFYKAIIALSYTGNTTMVDERKQ